MSTLESPPAQPEKNLSDPQTLQRQEALAKDLRIPLNEYKDANKQNVALAKLRRLEEQSPEFQNLIADQKLEELFRNARKASDDMAALRVELYAKYRDAPQVNPGAGGGAVPVLKVFDGKRAKLVILSKEDSDRLQSDGNEIENALKNANAALEKAIKKQVPSNRESLVSLVESLEIIYKRHINDKLEIEAQEAHIPQEKLLLTRELRKNIEILSSGLGQPEELVAQDIALATARVDGLVQTHLKKEFDGLMNDPILAGAYRAAAQKERELADFEDSLREKHKNGLRFTSPTALKPERLIELKGVVSDGSEAPQEIKIDYWQPERRKQLESEKPKKEIGVPVYVQIDFQEAKKREQLKNEIVQKKQEAEKALGLALDGIVPKDNPGLSPIRKALEISFMKANAERMQKEREGKELSALLKPQEVTVPPLPQITPSVDQQNNR